MIYDIKITSHAYEKAKERMKWKKKSLDNMAKKALERWVMHKDTKSKLHRYITKLYLSHKKCNNIRIYWEDLYFFRDTTLVTIYRLPTVMIKYLKL